MGYVRTFMEARKGLWWWAWISSTPASHANNPPSAYIPGYLTLRTLPSLLSPKFHIMSTSHIFHRNNLPTISPSLLLNKKHETRIITKTSSSVRPPSSNQLFLPTTHKSSPIKTSFLTNTTLPPTTNPPSTQNHPSLQAPSCTENPTSYWLHQVLTTSKIRQARTLLFLTPSSQIL